MIFSRAHAALAAAILSGALTLVTALVPSAAAVQIYVDPRAELLGSPEVVEATVWARVPAPRKDPPPGPWRVTLTSVGCGPPWDASTYLVRVERRYKGGDEAWLWLTGRHMKPGRKYLALASPYRRDPSILAVRVMVPMGRLERSEYFPHLKCLRSANPDDPDSLLLAPLLQDLKSPNDSLRAAALRILEDARLDHPRLIAALEEVLDHGSEWERLSVAGVVGRMPPGRAAGAESLLRRILRDPNPALRAEGMYSAVHAGWWDEVLKGLEDPYPSVRARCAFLIADRGREHVDGFGALLPLLQDPVAEVRAAALVGMIRHDAVASYPFWLESLESEAAVVRVAALRNAGTLLTTSARDSLWTAFLEDSAPGPRQIACDRLLSVANDVSRQRILLAGAVTDPDPGVRRWGLRRLSYRSQNQLERSVAALCLEDPDPTVRIAATRLWTRNKQLPPGWSETRLRGELLEVFVTAQDCDLRCEAHRELVDRMPPGDEQLLVLEYALTDPDPGIRGAALCSVSPPRCPRDEDYPYAKARALVLPLTEDENIWVRARAWSRLDYLTDD